MLIYDLSVTDIIKLHKDIADKLDSATNLEVAGNMLTHELYETFKESIVLVRIFSTITFSKLSKSKQDFATDLSSKIAQIHPEENTPVLTLMGSSGVEDKWNNISMSSFHQAIPLISENFISNIPMVSAVLRELNYKYDNKGLKENFITKTIGNSVGVFLVKDAKTETDNKNRKIITNQNFVNKYNINSVFGVAGKYSFESEFVAVIIFTRESLTEPHANQFLGLASLFTDKTSNLFEKNVIFEK